MPTEAKVREVEEFTALLRETKSVVLADFRGLNVEAANELRAKCREAGVNYRVMKNTLAKRCLEEVGMQGLEEFLEGPNAWATHPEDQVVAARILHDFAQDEDHSLAIRAGFMDGNVLSIPEVEALAKLPTRDVLLARIAGSLQAPMANFAGACGAVLRGFVTVVDAYRKQRADTDGES